ncbi:MAG: hypothetical protein ACRECH_08860 [Nitrososphaerales archaeon]
MSQEALVFQSERILTSSSPERFLVLYLGANWTAHALVFVHLQPYFMAGAYLLLLPVLTIDHAIHDSKGYNN